jgi:cytochrome oxidase Cu insertion factor (SCO1/SenC/PrrC family)
MSPRESTEPNAPRWYYTMAALVAAIALVIVAFFASQHYFGALMPGDDARRAEATTPAIGGPFSLTDQHGNTVTEADYRGRYMLIYFGFTYCPDVCPTTLATMAEALDLLGDEAEPIVPILITVDPERDTPEQLKMYVSHFSPRFVGLTGTPEQIASVAKEYKVYYAKAAEEGADADAYTMDHSSITYLMGPDGAYVRHFSHATTADQMAERLREAIAAAPAPAS